MVFTFPTLTLGDNFWNSFSWIKVSVYRLGIPHLWPNYSIISSHIGLLYGQNTYYINLRMFLTHSTISVILSLRHRSTAKLYMFLIWKWKINQDNRKSSLTCPIDSKTLLRLRWLPAFVLWESGDRKRIVEKANGVHLQNSFHFVLYHLFFFSFFVLFYFITWQLLYMFLHILLLPEIELWYGFQCETTE